MRRLDTSSTPETSTGVPTPRRPRPDGTRLPQSIAPVTLLVLAGVVVWNSLSLGYWTSLGPGPGFFPLWLAVLLAVLSCLWLVEQVRSGGGPTASAAPAPDSYAPTQEPETPMALGQLVTIVVSLVVLTALLEVLGFQLSMLLFLLFQLKILGRRRWLLTLVLSALGSFGIYTLFAQLLSVSLPVSDIAFLRSLGL